ncbi:MAG TPA: methyltransferase domain-containing protein [Solirubrobacteraceae bacterium]
MRRDAMSALRCPRCKAEGSFGLAIEAEDEREVREGELTCTTCGEARKIRGGIVDLMPEGVPAFVRREADGLGRFAEKMRAGGWDRELVLSLPYRQDGYWYAQATMMHQVLHTVPLRPGDTILDVGSNTCWAAAMLAERGLRVTALDITTAQMQGLATADWWYEAKGVHMERVLGVMFDISLASNSLDWVWCCEVLHHNHRANLWATMRELHRVLKPGGSLIVVNETLRTLREPHLHPGADVSEFEGHEHAYLRRSYVKAARDAGLHVDVRGPRLHNVFCEELFSISPRMHIRDGFRAAAAHAVRRDPRLRRAYLAWKSYVAGGTSLHMLATKPEG